MRGVLNAVRAWWGRRNAPIAAGRASLALNLDATRVRSPELSLMKGGRS
jgi:hypothetical protein